MRRGVLAPDNHVIGSVIPSLAGSVVAGDQILGESHSVECNAHLLEMTSVISQF